MRSRTDFPALTGVRALAASMVFFFHYCTRFQEPLWLFRLVKELQSGVVVFFVLSGFLIAYRYAEGYRPTGAWWKGYLQNRFARIYPVYFLLTVATLLLAGSRNLFEWFISLTILKGYFFTFRYHGIPQMWTLSIEETFYLSAPFIFILLRRFNPLVILGSFALIGTGLTAWGTGHDTTGMFMGDWKYVATSTFFGHVFAFLAGILLFDVVRARQDGAEDAAPKRAAIAATYVGLAGMIGCLLFQTALQNPTLDKAHFWEVSTWNWEGIGIQTLLFPPWVALFFYGLIFESSPIRRVLSSRLAVLLGKSSYSFYLIHFGIVASALERNPGVSHRWWLLFILLWAASVALYLGVEHPLQRRLRAAA